MAKWVLLKGDGWSPGYRGLAVLGGFRLSPTSVTTLDLGSVGQATQIQISDTFSVMDRSEAWKPYLGLGEF